MNLLINKVLTNKFKTMRHRTVVYFFTLIGLLSILGCTSKRNEDKRSDTEIITDLEKKYDKEITYEKSYIEDYFFYMKGETYQPLIDYFNEKFSECIGYKISPIASKEELEHAAKLVYAWIIRDQLWQDKEATEREKEAVRNYIQTLHEIFPESKRAKSYDFYDLLDLSQYSNKEIQLMKKYDDMTRDTWQPIIDELVLTLEFCKSNNDYSAIVGKINKEYSKYVGYELDNYAQYKELYGAIALIKANIVRSELKKMKK